LYCIISFLVLKHVSAGLEEAIFRETPIMCAAVINLII
jgi:hypothetical protein